ncbi:39S ribosomal protein L10, mitochondrial [Parus major]|uniref:39S ribosomal protein L10, mitochondrial n=1 Tax=Parus major TaxID=9157 RepID=UPI001444348C|nr:39S ribosomal protein L10, mitochondrial [Parus major]
MAALGGGGTRWRRAWLPALQLLRRGSKAVTRHWKAMHLQRQKLLALTEFLPPRPAVPPRCLPRHGTGEPRQVRPGPARHRHWEGFPAGLGTAGDTARPGLHRVWSAVGSCVHAEEGWAACRAEQSLPKGLEYSTPIPTCPFPGACIDGTILSRQGVESFARLPSLEVSQGQTVAALSLLSSQTSSLLQRGPAHLTALLDEHIRRLRDTAGAAEPPPGRSSGSH